MLLYTWAQWGHYLNGFLNVPVVLDIGGHMVCCLFICLCIFMILLADFDSIFCLQAVRKRALKCFAPLSGLQSPCILFCLFICTPNLFIYLFFQSSYILLLLLGFLQFQSLSGNNLECSWQNFPIQRSFDSLSVLVEQRAEATAGAVELTGFCTTRMGTCAIDCFPVCHEECWHAPVGSRHISYLTWLLVPFHRVAERHNRTTSCPILPSKSGVVKVGWCRLPKGKISLIFLWHKLPKCSHLNRLFITAITWNTHTKVSEVQNYSEELYLASREERWSQTLLTYT